MVAGSATALVLFSCQRSNGLQPLGQWLLAFIRTIQRIIAGSLFRQRRRECRSPLPPNPPSLAPYSAISTASASSAVMS